MRKYWWIGLVFFLVVGVSLVAWKFWPRDQSVVLSPEAPYLVIEKPLEKYSFENLKKRQYIGSEIKLERVLFKEDKYTAWLFKYTADKKVISGQMNIPTCNANACKAGRPEGGWPVVVMIRGYVDQEIYETGVGTRNGAGYLASNGFITLAPDFLGFGESEMPPNNVFEERFLRPIQVMELIASVKNIKEADVGKINIWGHSNGGQVALSVLEISGQKYPTSLWAPVSKPFPYSILYYTDEFDDYGKALRRELSGLEAQYNVDDFDMLRYLDWIKAPVQIHQGTNDDAVPLEWSQELESRLKKLDKQVELYVYPGADHNFLGPVSGVKGWDLAMSRSLSWFRN